MKADPTSSPPVGERKPAELEADWIRAARGGDREAFNRLVKLHQDAVLTAARHLVRTPEDAEDVAQETFLRAYRSLASYQGLSSFRTWLVTIAANAARSHSARRRAQKRSAREVRLDAEASGLEVPEPAGLSSPDAVALRNEAKEALEAAIADLDEESRLVVILRDLAGESYESIASALGLPLGTVKSRVHRARLQLRERLQGLL